MVARGSLYRRQNSPAAFGPSRIGMEPPEKCNSPQYDLDFLACDLENLLQQLYIIERSFMLVTVQLGGTCVQQKETTRL